MIFEKYKGLLILFYMFIRNIRLSLPILLVLFCYGNCLHAQDNNDTIYWTLDDCIEYALENNISISQSKLSYKQSLLQTEQSEAAWQPSLSFGTSYNYGFTPFAETNKNNFSGSYNLNANWTVFNGRRSKTIEQNKLSDTISLLNVENVENNVIESIMMQYMTVLYDQESMTTFADNVNVSKLQMERAKVMLDVGSIAKSDYASLASQYSNDRYSYLAAKNSMQQDLLQLKQLLEILDDINIGVVSPEYSESDVFAALPDKKIAFEKALENRPEIKMGKMYIERANQSVEIAKAGYLPNISLSAGTGIGHNLPSEMNFGEQVYRRWSNSIGVNLSIPILDNKQNKTNVENAKINVESQKLELIDKVKTLYMTIETLWLNARNSQEQYFAASEQLNAVQTSFDLVSEQFNLGMKNTTDLLTEKNKLISAQQDLIVAKYKAMYNIKILDFYQYGYIK